MYLNKYFEMPNNWGFADMGKFVHRKILRGSMRVGANHDIEQIMEEVGVHIMTDIKSTLAYKQPQLMKTESLQILMGAPDALTLAVMEPRAAAIIESIDEEIMEGRTLEKLHWLIETGRPIGMPWKVF